MSVHAETSGRTIHCHSLLVISDGHQQLHVPTVCCEWQRSHVATCDKQQEVQAPHNRTRESLNQVRRHLHDTELQDSINGVFQGDALAGAQSKAGTRAGNH